MLTILPPQKLNNGSITLLVQTITCHDPFLCYVNILQTLGSSYLSSIDQGIPTNSTHSDREYWGFFQHCLSIDGICLDRILFTYLITETSDSNFYKFSFKGLISAVGEAIVVLVCSWVLPIDIRENLCFTEFSTKIYWNSRLAASDVFHVYTINYLSSFNSIIVQMSEKRDSSNRQ